MSFIQRLEKRAKEMDQFERNEGSVAFDKKYSRSGKRTRSKYIDSEARYSSKKRCEREEAKANRELTQLAKEVDSTTFPRRPEDSSTRLRAIRTLNSYHNDINARRSCRTQKKRRLDTSTGYSFQSDSSDSENDDDDGEGEEEDNKEDDESLDSFIEDDDTSEPLSNCSSAEYPVFPPLPPINKKRRVLDDSDDDNDDDDNVSRQRKRILIDDCEDDDDVEDNNDLTDSLNDPCDDDDSPGGDIPCRHDHVPLQPQYSIPPVSMQLPTPIIQVPMMSVSLYHPYSFHPQFPAPPVLYQHQYVTTQGHVPGLSVSTHVPDSNKHTEKWMKKYNMLREKSKEDSFVLTRDYLSFPLYDWFNEQKKQKRASLLSPWKQQYLDNVLGSDW